MLNQSVHPQNEAGATTSLLASRFRQLRACKKLPGLTTRELCGGRCGVVACVRYGSINIVTAADCDRTQAWPDADVRGIPVPIQLYRSRGLLLRTGV